MAGGGSSPTPTHTIFILLIVLSIMGLPLMMPEVGEGGPLFPSLEDLNPLLMLAPLLLLLVVRLTSSRAATDLCLNADAGAIHRLSGSSLGVVLLLLIVLAMISFRSAIQESWGVAQSE